MATLVVAESRVKDFEEAIPREVAEFAEIQ
jgi:hypothetical protein